MQCLLILAMLFLSSLILVIKGENKNLGQDLLMKHCFSPRHHSIQECKGLHLSMKHLLVLPDPLWVPTKLFPEGTPGFVLKRDMEVTCLTPISLKFSEVKEGGNAKPQGILSPVKCMHWVPKSWLKWFWGIRDKSFNFPLLHFPEIISVLQVACHSSLVFYDHSEP